MGLFSFFKSATAQSAVADERPLAINEKDADGWTFIEICNSLDTVEGLNELRNHYGRPFTRDEALYFDIRMESVARDEHLAVRAESYAPIARRWADSVYPAGSGANAAFFAQKMMEDQAVVGQIYDNEVEAAAIDASLYNHAMNQAEAKCREVIAASGDTAFKPSMADLILAGAVTGTIIKHFASK